MENMMNPFVQFMGNYDLTTADYTKIYDEYTSKVQFEIESEINKTILNTMKSSPTSIIITGNAGDGKTRICRNVYTALTEKELEQWDESGIEDIVYNGKKIRIIKDLSELQDSVINKELNHLKNAMQTEDVFYLIAANEGKLTHALLQDSKLAQLFKIIVMQLTDPAGEKNEKLHVYNLLHSSSSIYAQNIIKEWNEEDNWMICNNCKQQRNCIIYHNHEKLKQKEVRMLLNRIYRSLDTTQVHMTIRELLIQLTYLHLGGLSCTDIHSAKNKELQEQARKVYYENLFGHSAPDTLFEDIPAFSEIQKYDPGLLSNSKVDDFILNGDLSGDASSEQHKELFGKTIDTEYGFFQQDLSNYRSLSNQENAGQHLAKYWLPRLRRKYYFEINTTKSGMKSKKIVNANEHSMIAYKHRVNFLHILKENRVDLRFQKDLIRGLNYYFSKQLVSSPENSLYVVSDKLFVHRIVSASDMRWGVETANKEIDYKASHIYLSIDHVFLKINLILFEYLMRLANGGLPHILNDDVEILLSNFKNNLIINKKNDSTMLQILKFNAKKDAYELREIEVSKKATDELNNDAEDEWDEDDFD
ncbi:hypothetical protein [Kurthia huakuii]|uniref:hypothetical protein n=1 Tax=Kurthia huakuii TaxID=1421019 RepID=UPI0004957C36|nr:hypothetical protein [Kurthia huakuii]MBM7700995.1 hypothetical protein [Kurthia huakuii]